MFDVSLFDWNNNYLDKSVLEMLKKPNVENMKTIFVFFSEILTKELFGCTEKEIMLNKFIVKGSNDKFIYDNYIEELTKLNYNQYHDKLKKLIVQDRVVENYSIENKEILDYNNQVEMMITDKYLDNLLKLDNKMNIHQMRWLSEYIIYRQSELENLIVNAKAITLKDVLKDHLKNNEDVLEAKNYYFSIYGECSGTKRLDGDIKIHIDKIKRESILNGDFNLIYELLLTCYHELEHVNQNKLLKTRDNHPMSLQYYKLFTECQIISYRPDIYSNDCDKFELEIIPDLVAIRKIKKLLKLKDGTSHINDNLKDVIKNRYNELLNKLNMANLDYFVEVVDDNIKNHPSDRNANEYFKLIYDKWGNRKTTYSIIKSLLINKVNDTELQTYLIVNSLKKEGLGELPATISYLDDRGKKMLFLSIINYLKKIELKDYKNNIYCQLNMISEEECNNNKLIITNEYKEIREYVKVVQENENLFINEKEHVKKYVKR